MNGLQKLRKVSEIVSNISKMVKELEQAGNYHAGESDFHASRTKYHTDEAVRAQTIRVKIADLIGA